MKQAKKSAQLLLGKTIKRIRPMTEAECQALYWFTPGIVIEFEDGTTLYASQDEEQNGPGVFCGHFPDGAFFGMYVTDKKRIGMV